MENKRNSLARISFPFYLFFMQKTLRDLLLHEMRDLYDAEHQILQALATMADAASNEDLKTAFKEHATETEGQIERLEKAFKALGESAERKKCKGIEGLLKEASSVLEEDMTEVVMDAAIIAASQRVEHYEMAGYGCATNYARVIGEHEVMNLLLETLSEEKNADHRLTEIAEGINEAAAR